MSQIDSPSRWLTRARSVRRTAPHCVESDVKFTQDGQGLQRPKIGWRRSGKQCWCRVGLSSWYHIGPCPLRGPPSWSRFQNPVKALVLVVRPPAALKPSEREREASLRVGMLSPTSKAVRHANGCALWWMRWSSLPRKWSTRRRYQLYASGESSLALAKHAEGW